METKQTGGMNIAKALGVNSKFKFVLLSFVLIFFFSFLSAAPPIQRTLNLELGVSIEAPIIEYHQLNESFKFHIHAHNVTTGVLLDNTTTYCISHIYRPSDGGHVLEQNMTFDSNGIDFEMNAQAGNFTEIGQYAVLFYCEVPGNVGGFLEYPFMVNPTGAEGGISYYILFLILSLGIVLIGYYTQDSWITILGAFGLILFGLYVLFFGIVGIKDVVYTWGVGIITIMLGAYFAVRGALEQVDF